MNTIIIRQGDLTLRRVSDDTETTTAAREEVLAVGEESGHCHLVQGVISRSLTEILEGLVVVPEETHLRIGGQPWRHDPIRVPAGTWAYSVQRELTEDEEMEEVRSVQD